MACFHLFLLGQGPVSLILLLLTSSSTVAEAAASPTAATLLRSFVRSSMFGPSSAGSSSDVCVQLEFCFPLVRFDFLPSSFCLELVATINSLFLDFAAYLILCLPCSIFFFAE